MAIGYSLNFTLAAGAYTPAAKASAAGNLTMSSGGTALTIPWVENANSGTGDTTSTRLSTAVQAGLRSMLNDLAKNGAPT